MVSLAEKNDYLKKYLSTDADKKKKKKTKKSHNSGLLIEEDMAFAKVAPGSSSNRGHFMPHESDSEDDEIQELNTSKKSSGFIADSFQTIGSPKEDSVDGESEVAVPLKKIKQEEDLSPGRKDSSLVRRRRHDSPKDSSPVRRRRHDSPKDSSPVRRRRHDSGSRKDSSPPRRRHDSPKDSSPPRRRRDSPKDSSPPRRRHHSPKDSSPPRRRRHDSPKDSSPPRRSRHDSGSRKDSSPPRRRHDSPKDLLPPRKIKKEIDLSPPRRRRNDSPNDSSPKRRRNDSPERSPPRRKQRHDSKSPVRSNQQKNKEPSPDQNQVRRKRLTREQEARNTRESQKQAEINEKYSAVSKGVAQAEMRQQKIKEMEQVAQEDFTRYADDKSMNEHLKEQLLGEDDPMNEYMSKKNMKIRMKSEFIYPRYSGHFPPNRYSIAPGYRWDGVDRSNGFEGKMSMRENRQKAEDSAAYRMNAEMAE